MRKIFYQWAGIGILALIGWGVDLMPSNASWIPSGIIWGIAFVWLMGTLIYWLKNRKQLDNKVKYDQIRQKLSNLFSEGKRIKDKCYDESVEAPRKEAETWAEKATNYIRDNLGEDYAVTFNSQEGLPTVRFTTLSGEEKIFIESNMDIRLTRLDRFLAELRLKH